MLVENNVQVAVANVSSVVGWHTSDIDDDAQNHEPNASNDLDDREHEFDLFDVLARVLLQRMPQNSALTSP